MTRQIPIIFILPLILLVAGACVAEIKSPSEQESSTVATQVEASPLPAPNSTIIPPTVTDPTCCLGGAVGSYPAPLGYAVPLGDGRLVVGVLEVTRPADDIIARASPNNPIPISGSEYRMVKVVLQCMAEPSNTDNPCDLGLGVRFRVIDSAGTYYEEAPGLAEVADRFELPDNINTAFTTIGNVVFLVPTPTSDLVLEFCWPNNACVLLALE